MGQIKKSAGYPISIPNFPDFLCDMMEDSANSEFTEKALLNKEEGEELLEPAIRVSVTATDLVSGNLFFRGMFNKPRAQQAISRLDKISKRTFDDLSEAETLVYGGFFMFMCHTYFSLKSNIPVDARSEVCVTGDLEAATPFLIKGCLGVSMKLSKKYHQNVKKVLLHYYHSLSSVLRQNKSLTMEDAEATIVQRLIEKFMGKEISITYAESEWRVSVEGEEKSSEPFLVDSIMSTLSDA